MAAEVTELCGLKHSPSLSDHYRADSNPGRVLVEGELEEVVRPRVRRQGEDGSSREVELASYRLAKDPAQLQAQVIRGSVAGVSGRSMQDLKPKYPGVSRSNVSRLRESTGGKFIEKLRGKDLSAVTWCGLMLDGIRLSSDQTAVVALGIDNKGNKQVLDFVLGSSENSEVSRELMGRIVKRGFQCEHRLYVVLDGSDALRVAVREFFHDAIVQRCLVHKERNIKGKLSKRHWGELSRLFTRLRSVQGIEAAKEVYDEFAAFLKRTNAEAYRSLQEAGDELLALHRKMGRDPLNAKPSKPKFSPARPSSVPTKTGTSPDKFGNEVRAGAISRELMASSHCVTRRSRVTWNDDP
jgi:transposase-like protein